VNIDTYQKKAYSTAAYPRHFAFEYLALQLAAEAGEVSGKIGKLIRKGYNVPDHLKGQGAINIEAREALKHELGDVLWYVAAMAKELNISLSEIAESNLEKLASRAERGVIHGDGDNR